MERDVANIIISSCYNSTRCLGELSPIIKEHCAEEDYINLRKAIGSSVYDILENIVKYVYSKNPDIAVELEARIEKYGRAF